MTDDADEQLMSRLRRIAAAVNPRPALIDEAARGALSTRHLDELARLIMDSEEGSPLAVRGRPGEVRLLSFNGGGVSVALQVGTTDAGVLLRGLVSGTTGTLTVESPRTSSEVVPDGDGWFTAADVPEGLCRLRLRAATGGRVATEWFDV